jgi:hypothetical protein
LALSLELDGVKDVRRVLSLGHEDLLHATALGFQEFEDGVAPLDLVSTETVTIARG